jgi:hypothetical protein
MKLTPVQKADRDAELKAKRGFLAVSFAILIYILDLFAVFGYVGDATRSLPPWYAILTSTIAGGTFILLIFGIFGFWLVIPAFQKWRHTKNEWIAWVFLAVSVFSIILFYNLLNTIF